MALIKKEDVKLIRLVTGEELVAEVKGYFNNRLHVLHPLQLMTRMDQQKPGHVNIGLVPWIVYAQSADGLFIINDSAIVTIVPCANELVKNFIQANSSIALPTSNIIV